MNSKYIIFCLILFSFIIMTNTSNAQDKPKSQEEIELEKQATIAKLKYDIALAEFNAQKAKKEAEDLKAPLDEKQQAELDKAIAEANKASVQAKREMYKGPDVTAPSGKITSDGTFIESRMLSQKTLANTMATLAKNIKADTNFKNIEKVTFVIHNPSDVLGLELYATLKDQAEGMKKAYTSSNKNLKSLVDKQMDFTVQLGTLGGADPLLAGYVASGILRTAADLVSLFKTTRDFKNFDLTIDDTNLTAVFKKNIGKAKVYHPAVFPVNTIASAGNSIFVDIMSNIQKLSVEGDGIIEKADKRLKTLNEEYGKEKDPAVNKRRKTFIDSFEPVIAELKSLKSAFNQLQTMLSTADATTKVTAQAAVMRAERLFTLLSADTTFTIKFSVTSKGSNKVSDNLWRSARIEHSAGTELNCLIFSRTGEIVFAESIVSYQQYLGSKQIK